jgi:hypothetical protein
VVTVAAREGVPATVVRAHRRTELDSSAFISNTVTPRKRTLEDDEGGKSPGGSGVHTGPVGGDVLTLKLLSSAKIFGTPIGEAYGSY